jgi:hypothetical protein
MTDRFYGVTLGEQSTDKVGESAATVVGDTIELRVAYDTTGFTKERVLAGLKAIEHYIVKDGWPPV